MFQRQKGNRLETHHRSLSYDVPRKQQRVAEGVVKGDMDADVTDLIAQVYLMLSLYTTRVMGEGPGVDDVLHSFPTNKERHSERDARRRQCLQRVGFKPPSWFQTAKKERSSLHIWCFLAMLRATEKIMTSKHWHRAVSRSDQGKAKTMSVIQRNTQNTTPIEADKSIQTSYGSSSPSEESSPTNGGKKQMRTSMAPCSLRGTM